MEKDKAALQNGFRLLKTVLQEAFQTQAVLLVYPYEDIKKIDYGLRAMVWTDYNDRDTKVNLLEYPSRYRLLVVKSNLGFYNILALISGGNHPDFISIGPFRDEELSADYFAQILKESNVAPSELAEMKGIYERMPLVQVETILKVSQYIIGSFIPEYEELSAEYIQYSEQKRKASINLGLIQDYSAEFAEKYRELLFFFLEQLKSGDLSRTKTALELFLQETKIAMTKSIHEYKTILHMLNDYCHMGLLETNLHPSHIIKQANSFRSRIDGAGSRARLEQLPGEMCRKYCLLVRNYTNQEYSRLVRDVINYVQFHLEEELSLAVLADHFGKNPSVLSNTFSKETGQGLTKFIQQTRMSEAIRLFNTTDMSVSEVALMVGYQDFSYFSKLFTKYVGCSPKEYRGKI